MKFKWYLAVTIDRDGTVTRHTLDPHTGKPIHEKLAAKWKDLRPYLGVSK